MPEIALRNYLNALGKRVEQFVSGRARQFEQFVEELRPLGQPNPPYGRKLEVKRAELSTLLNKVSPLPIDLISVS
jgi:hypothetical protein